MAGPKEFVRYVLANHTKNKEVKREGRKIAGHNPGITFKAQCVKAEGNDLIFLADAEDVAYFKKGISYVIHATRFPDVRSASDAGDSTPPKPGTKT